MPEEQIDQNNCDHKNSEEVEVFDINPPTIGERLRAARCEKKMTLQQVATFLRTSRTNIDEMEQGLKKADHYGRTLLERLCDVYDVSFEEYLVDFERDCPCSETKVEDDGQGDSSKKRRPSDFIFSDEYISDEVSHKEVMRLPAVFITVLLIAILLVIAGSWGVQKYRVWRVDQKGGVSRLDMLELLPKEKIPEVVLPIPE
ncbi:MAG: helix-turn-helix domain-containing protein [Lentisphaeria bacterium]